LQLVLIEGESGVGKSELVAEFLRRARLRHTGLVALRGRCYENEQVSYKAFDGCIDELAKLLSRMSEAECEALLPARAALLGQLFPVLRSVKAIGEATREGVSADPSARRLEAFGALAQLLNKLAEERPVVLVLDDLQWADAESFRLLGALNAQTPRPPILLLGTVRLRQELDHDLRERLDDVRKWQHTEVVTLRGLPRMHAKELARTLLPKGAPETWLELIAEESQGHPLFIGELVQYTQSHDFASRGTLTLEAALRARIEHLDRPARELLELVAVAARPHPLPIFASSLSGNVQEAARTLLASKLLRQRKGNELGCYHDRIRHTAEALIAKSRLPSLHHQLAAALDMQPDTDASERAHHWDLAGEPERACAAYEMAAGHALETLAFARAALFCERAIALLGRASDDRLQRLTVRRADALACAGRSGEAAALYQQAADVAQGEARIRLRGRAAKHLMLSASIEPGFMAARKLLMELGFRLPLSTAGGLVLYAWESLRVGLTSEPGKSPPRDVARERLALDVVREITSTISIVHPLAFLVLTMQYARREANVGGALYSALALTSRGWLKAIQGSLGAAKPLLERGRAVVESEGSPLAVAMHAYTTGSAYAAGLDWSSAAPWLEKAQRIVQEQCPDNPSLLTSIRYHLGANWFMRGEHAKLAGELDGWLAEARERNDALGDALLMGMGFGFARQLMRDAPQAALDELDRSIAPIPLEPYSFPHLGHMLGTVQSLLYRGGPSALRFLDAYEAKHDRSFLLRTATGRGVRSMLRLLALLNAYASAPSPDRPPLLKQIRALARALSHARSPHTRGLAMLASAQIAALEGQRETATELAREVLNTTLQHQLGTAVSSKYLLGLLEGGSAGRRKCEAAVAEMRAKGWREPLRAFELTVPLLGLLGDVKPNQPELDASRPALLLDRYEVTGLLGSGGFGAVVAARDVRSGRKLALKELVRTGATSIERFKREFRALSDLHSENVVQLEALFEHEGTWFIAMELLDGTDLISHVRSAGAVDSARVCNAFAGVARGLSALHQMGLVHRDVKPENVMITAEGRAVLIDFGLCARAGEQRESAGVGSMQWAAPEQLRGSPPAVAADVYALGACLYQALSGEPPGGDTMPLAAIKRRTDTALPRLAGLEAVAELCVRMLAERPAERPSLSEVLSVLTDGEESSAPSKHPSQAHALTDDAIVEANFSGRHAELLRLQTSLARVPTAGSTVVLVEGESGLGKSALVNHFAKRAQSDISGLCLLRSRCYENEQVAYKAFDGAADQLAELLRALPEPACEAVLPKRAALLAQLFPVLGSVPAIANAPKKGLPADPAARKQAGCECFLELLEKLSAHGPLLLIVDDLQWADSESFDLLRALAQRGSRLSVLLLCTVRPAAEIEGMASDELSRLYALQGSERVSLGMLDERSSIQLARQLLGVEVSEARLLEVARESKGHPLFLRELVAHQKNGLGLRQGELTLDAALGARIDSLLLEAQGLLALVALADKPYEMHVYARALGRSALPREALLALLGHGLLRRRGNKLACDHDRIRRVALLRLSPEERVRTARALASALSRDQHADAAERARLWDQAGERQQASAAYEQAADQALESLAFARAEKHYTRALELSDTGPRDARWRTLMVGRGHALVRAGRSAEAAPMFQQAAEHATGDEAMRLRLWAAQHLIQSAQVEAGMGAAADLLSDLGLSLPQSDRAAKTRIVWERTRITLRGIELKHQKTSAHERLVLEALHGLSSPVRAMALLPGSALVVQYLRRALDAGGPVHAARALAYEALWRALNAPKHQDELFDQSRALAEATSDPALIAEVELTHGVACSAQYKFRAAPTHLWRAHDLLQAQCPGEPWLLTAARMYLGTAWLYSGNFQDIRRHAGGWLEEARARDDRYAIAAITGFGAAAMRHATEDEPERALAELEAAMAPWPQEPFTTNHFGAFQSAAYILAGCEQGPKFMQFLAQRRPQLERAFFMRTLAPGLFWRVLRLQALLQTIDSPRNAEGVRLRKLAHIELRAIRRVPGPIAETSALAFAAWLHWIEDERERALACMRRACEISTGIEHFAIPGMHYVYGSMEGGESGKKRCDEARARIEAEGWKSWRRGLAMRVYGNLNLLDG
jgi:predicted ATPase/tRNA A-37 threonylcarbamoyl transferase component Bud32